MCGRRTRLLVAPREKNNPQQYQCCGRISRAAAEFSRVKPRITTSYSSCRFAKRLLVPHALVADRLVYIARHCCRHWLAINSCSNDASNPWYVSTKPGAVGQMTPPQFPCDNRLICNFLQRFHTQRKPRTSIIQLYIPIQQLLQYIRTRSEKMSYRRGVLAWVRVRP